MKLIEPEIEEKIRFVVRTAGQEAAKMAADKFQVSQKAPGDYVTSIDRWLDRHLTAIFAQLFPEDGIITEENEQSRQAYHAGYNRLWCIDPLDGTEDFIKGEPHYALMVGLLSDNQPQAGWIYAPSRDKLYYGGSNWGLFQTSGDSPPQPLPVQKPILSQSLCRIIIGTKDQKNFGTAITQHIPQAEFYGLGSFGLKVLEVIQGKADLYVYFNRRVKLWDTTGPIALAKAAGLTCCDLQGQPLSFHNSAVEPDTLIHNQSIIIGWPDYIDSLLPKIQKAVFSITN